jgi:hypothetical protein
MSHKNKILEDLEEYFSEESGKKEYKYQDPKTGEEGSTKRMEDFSYQ